MSRIVLPETGGLEQAAFICGCGHSGTTLVATILSVHPSLYVPLYESEVFLEEEAVGLERLADLRLAALRAGKRILVEKTPRHVLKMDVIRRVVRGARFILLVRDGRDVAASIAHREHGDFEAGIERWIHDNTFVLQEQDQPDVILVRYEDLVVAPSMEMSRICAFLDVPYFDDLLRYHQQPHFWHGERDIRRTSGVGDEHASYRNWQVNQPIFDGRGRWMRELPAGIVAELSDGRGAPLMRAFGYLHGPV